MSDWTDAERVGHIAECIEDVGYRWHLLEHAKTLPDQAEAITGLANAISDLKSWHPGYDDRNGTLPWERESE
jgi:hypothetical protein